MDQWVQFALLMLALIGIAIRTEHRITLIEGALEVERVLRKLADKRIDKLEAHLP